MNRESSLYLCTEKQCQKNILISNNKDFLTHKLHNFITLTDFTLKFEPAVIRQFYDEENKKQNQLEELKEQIIAQFKILLETYIKVNKPQEVLLNEIIEEWGSENTQYLRQNQFKIRDLWFKDQKQRQSGEESSLVREFKDHLESFRSLNQVVAQNDQEELKQHLISSSLKNLQFNRSSKQEVINRIYSPIILSDSDPQLKVCSHKQYGTQFTLGSIYKFSEDMKHSKMVMISAIRVKSTANTPMVSLINLPLDISGPVQKFGFKHVAGSLNVNVAFGVCHTDIVRRKAFSSKPGLGEGMYMFQNDGSNLLILQQAMYSHFEDHSKSSKNIKSLLLNPVYFYFIPKENKLIIKSPKFDQIELKVKAQGLMAPCVAVSSADQEIEVIQPFDTPDL